MGLMNSFKSGISIQVSWDVYNWLFDQDLNNGHVVFMFKFENEGFKILEGIEWKKMRKSCLRTARSSSSSSTSMSSASSAGSSSVMEWASVEESELSALTGF
ncbi:hypothetical protein GOBAR_DD05109 [Gossypium barbadense]|nr:hypothetical protein GOBAR_DD05109 [Gossypium barbadense]